jgi:hypothetical protein
MLLLKCLFILLIQRWNGRLLLSSGNECYVCIICIVCIADMFAFFALFALFALKIQLVNYIKIIFFVIINMF